MARRPRWVRVLALAFGVLPAGTLRAEEPRADLVVVVGWLPRTLDPVMATSPIPETVLGGLFEGLTRRDAATGRVMPGQAESWETSEDGRRWVFHLRADARWTNGEPVTAHDFVRGWLHLLDPETGADWASVLHVIRHARAYSTYADVVGSHPLHAERRKAEFEEAKRHFGKDEGVYAMDDRTLIVELEGYAPWFLKTLALPRTAPRRPPPAAGPDLNSLYMEARWVVSNGPYLAAAWESERRMRLRRNPAYWGASDVRLKTIEVVVEPEVRHAELFRAGNADWLFYVGDLAVTTTGGMLKDLYAEPSLASYFLRVNCTRSPFSDPRVRRALALAIDRSALASKSGSGASTVLDSVVPRGMDGYLPPESLLQHDPPQARRLLAEAGFPGGKGFPLIDYVLNEASGHRRIAENLARMWETNLGIHMRLRGMEWAAFLKVTGTLDYDIARSGWVLDYPDPQNALEMWTSGSTENRTGWSDARFDRLVKHAGNVFGFLAAPESEQEEVVRVAHDPEALRAAIDALRTAKPADRLLVAQALRMELLREAEAILVQEAFPVIPLYQYGTHGAISPRVEGFHVMLTGPDGSKVPNVEGIHPLRDLGVRK